MAIHNEKKKVRTKKEGGVYTPLFIVQTVCDLAGYIGEKTYHKHVIDNSCGDGAFLCEIIRRYCEYSKIINIPLVEI